MLFGRINHHQLLNEYVFCFLSNIIINCQEQLKTTQKTEKKKEEGRRRKRIFSSSQFFVLFLIALDS